MNGTQGQGYPENAPPQGGTPPYDPRQYAAVPPAAPPTWSRSISDFGVAPGLAGDPRRKGPALAGLLSIMPGLGQVYVGYYQQGFLHIIVVATIIVLLSVHGNDTLRSFDPFLGLFLAFFWLYNIVDAYRRAAFYNQALAGVGALEIPEDMRLPKGSGSMVGGIALIALGLLFFANTALGMSLAWVEQWWPMGLVLLGAYLVYGSWTSKKSAAATAGNTRDTGQPS